MTYLANTPAGADIVVYVFAISGRVWVCASKCTRNEYYSHDHFDLHSHLLI